MTDTLFDATLKLARALMQIRTGTADSGTTTELVDANRRESKPDMFNGGTLWHHDLEEFTPISDYDGAGTFTLQDALSSAVSADDRYSIASSRYPLDWLIDAINMALTDMKYPVTDTSITTVTNTSEYDLPASVVDLRVVMISTNDEADNNEWKFVPANWEMQKTATGTANKLVFDRDLTSGETLKLVHVKYHDELYTASGQIDEFIQLPRIIPTAVVHIITGLLMDGTTGDKALETGLAIWREREARAEAKHYRPLPRIQGKIVKVDF